MNDSGKTFAFVAAVILATLAAIYGALYMLFDGLSTAHVAGIVLLAVVGLVAGVAVTLSLVSRLWAVRQSTPRNTNVIDADYWRAYDLPNYQSPRVQLPAPRVVNVPRYSYMGTAQPWNAQSAQAPVLQTTVDDDATGQVELAIPLDIALKFAGLPTPSRAEWTGKRENYTLAAKFFDVHGMLDKTPNGGWRWKAEYPLESRKQWLLQFGDVEARE
jgi:hypothetical protein